MPGTLFVVATPIGNLEDLTFRALRTLREVDLIAAEDTRRTSKLLAHYEVRKPLVSLREHNEAKQGARLVAELEQGKQIALVTDAGTPGIADPGVRFVRLARSKGVRVVPIPGCSAVIAALSASGVEADEFFFAGFVPAGSKRIDWLNDLIRRGETSVFFDTPHSINTTISLLNDIYVKRPILIWRELTKIHEESVEAAPGERLPRLHPKGEFVGVVGANRESHDPGVHELADSARMSALFDYLTNNDEIDESLALSIISRRFEVSISVAKKALKKHRILVKQGKEAIE